MKLRLPKVGDRFFIDDFFKNNVVSEVNLNKNAIFSSGGQFNIEYYFKRLLKIDIWTLGEWKFL